MWGENWTAAAAETINCKGTSAKCDLIAVQRLEDSHISISSAISLQQDRNWIWKYVSLQWSSIATNLSSSDKQIGVFLGCGMTKPLNSSQETDIA